MISILAQPSATLALVVGIEQYAAGKSWDLNGPAHDAVKFTAWLESQGVPSSQIIRCLAPLQKNATSIEAAAPDAQLATRQGIHNALTSLSSRQGELLVIYWSGHGILTPAESRRLFYSDATAQSMLNLDLNDLLLTLRSSSFPQLDQQLIVVDTCANYVASSTTSLPSATFAAGKPLSDRRQYALYAAATGELAKNLDREQTGLFTREILSYLKSAAPGTWPPDLSTLVQHLHKRFSDLRAKGETQQTPADFWYRDWKGSVGRLGEPIVVIPTSAASSSTTAMLLSANARQDAVVSLLDLVEAIPSIRNPGSREVLLSNLRPEIFRAIPRVSGANLRVEVINVLETCLNYANGIQDLLRRIRLMDGESEQVRELETKVKQLGLSNHDLKPSSDAHPSVPMPGPAVSSP